MGGGRGAPASHCPRTLSRAKPGSVPGAHVGARGPARGQQGEQGEEERPGEDVEAAAKWGTGSLAAGTDAREV